MSAVKSISTIIKSLADAPKMENAIIQKKKAVCSSEDLMILSLKFTALFALPENGDIDFMIDMNKEKGHKGYSIWNSLESGLVKFASAFEDGRELKGRTTKESPEKVYMFFNRETNKVQIGMADWSTEQFIDFDYLWHTKEFADTIKQFIDYKYNGNYFIARKRTPVAKTGDIAYRISVDYYGKRD